jgi:hypothetical protein
VVGVFGGSGAWLAVEAGMIKGNACPLSDLKYVTLRQPVKIQTPPIAIKGDGRYSKQLNLTRHGVKGATLPYTSSR